ncbi:MAG: hypothetical protein MK193_04435 [Lentisphaeria bacterium]|nr:hypothetical protein [Lentisphaeria bacterium]
MRLLLTGAIFFCLANLCFAYDYEVLIEKVSKTVGQKPLQKMEMYGIKNTSYSYSGELSSLKPIVSSQMKAWNIKETNIEELENSAKNHLNAAFGNQDLKGLKMLMYEVSSSHKVLVVIYDMQGMKILTVLDFDQKKFEEAMKNNPPQGSPNKY